MRWLGAILIAGVASGQVTPRRPYVRSSGEGIVTIRPDQASVSLGVITQGATAAAATDGNASKAGAIMDALRRLLGQTADIRTVSFTVSPVQRFPANGGLPEITGYTATNQFRVVISDTSATGRVIDTATAAGANLVGGVNFGVRDPTPLRQQALRMATQQARANAEAIATGMSARLGAVISAAESSVATPILSGGPTAAVNTPIESGTLEIRASVTLEVEVLQ
jgi:uncharacterized protein YggE